MRLSIKQTCERLKVLPYLFKYKSHFFLFQNIAKKVRCNLHTNKWSLSYATQIFSEVFPCYRFLCCTFLTIDHIRCESHYTIYSIIFLISIALAIAFRESHITLSTLSSFSQSITLIIAYPHESCFVASYALHHGAIMCVVNAYVRCSCALAIWWRFAPFENSNSSDDFDGIQCFVMWLQWISDVKKIVCYPCQILGCDLNIHACRQTDTFYC